MVTVVIEKPYKFVPPHRGNWWPNFIQAFRLYDIHLWKKDGVVSCELRNEHLLTESMKQNHGIIVAPNHCRYADPLAIGWLFRKVNTHVFAMASWHLFNMGWFNTFALKKMGAFSVFREGNDKQSIKTAIDTLVDGERPLVLFPEGATFRANDHVQPLLEGVSFIARTAARRREKASTGKVVIHPVGIKYVFQGDIMKWADSSLGKIERQLTWRNSHQMTLLDRISRAADGILALKEIEHFGNAKTGNYHLRKDELVEQLISRIEAKRDDTPHENATVLSRVKTQRTKILPQLIESASRHSKTSTLLRRELFDLDLAQQLSTFPRGYLDEPPVTETRLLETLENMEESIFGKSSFPGPLKVIIEVAPAIEVPSDRAPKKTGDPLLEELHSSMSALINRLQHEPKLINLRTEPVTE